ncbi:MAG TPA: alpha/beta fold hydrolase, partial [Solirubrobacteraceae bacterium]|nr:alpha/beta fold hydrolase [Solirubrobacteraceae bacterium]
VFAVRRMLSVGAASILMTLSWTAAASARDVVVRSFDGTPIVAHFYPAGGLAAGEQAPTVLIGPGYGNRADTKPEQNVGDRIGSANLRNAGFNVVTWDPRGFGGSGGVAMFDSPAFEGRDVQALVDYVADQREALLDAAGDPRVGMSGSSYGGAIQLVAAAIEPRLDAIVPDVAWHSLVTSFARDRAFKAGWLLLICAGGEVLGLADGLINPAGVQLGSTAPQLKTMCVEGNVAGRLSPATTSWLAERGPAGLLDAIRAPALITQGTIDTLFPPGQAVANYDVLRRNGVPVKMLWYCGGHGTCPTPAGEAAVLRRAGLNWLRRWLMRDKTVHTGPRFEWVDDRGAWRSGPDYPLALDGSVGASGAGSLGLLPSASVTLGPLVLETPALSRLEFVYDAPPAAADVVGEPTISLSYRGRALPASTFVYAQVVDARMQRVVGGQVTPIPVVLDGRQRTVKRKLEAIALRAHPSSDLRLRLLPSTALYGPQRSTGSVASLSVTSTLPIVDATRSGR